MAYDINIYEYGDKTITVEVFDSKFLYPILVNTLNVKKEDEFLVDSLIESYRGIGRVNINRRTVV